MQFHQEIAIQIITFFYLTGLNNLVFYKFLINLSDTKVEVEVQSQGVLQVTIFQWQHSGKKETILPRLYYYFHSMDQMYSGNKFIHTQTN